VPGQWLQWRDLRVKFGGLQVSEATRLREIEAENCKLKKLLAAAHRASRRCSRWASA